MRARRWSSFWTTLAAIAGVIGAGAAVYPLLQTDQQAAHLAFSYDDRPPHDAWVVTLSEPVILTGRWYIRRSSWWRISKLQAGSVVGQYGTKYIPAGEPGSVSKYLGSHITVIEPLKDVHLPQNKKLRVAIDTNANAVEQWAGGSLVRCEVGELEIGIEYKWKAGISWMRTPLPFCIR